MNRLQILSVCLCFALSVSTVDAKGYADAKHSTRETNIQNGFPNIFRPVGNIFKRLFGIKPLIIYEDNANVINLTLSRSEVTASCSTNKNFCSVSKGIGVYTEAVDPDNDYLLYVYTVSGGKIIGAANSVEHPEVFSDMDGQGTGKGTTVIWDLSGVKAGTYTITAGVDDGCGGCGLTQTRTIKVIECPDCK